MSNGKMSNGKMSNGKNVKWELCQMGKMSNGKCQMGMSNGNVKWEMSNWKNVKWDFPTTITTITIKAITIIITTIITTIFTTILATISFIKKILTTTTIKTTAT